MIGRKRILIVSLCVLFFSCKKDKNIDVPSVQIIQPAGIQTFNVFDTIMVKAHVSDAQGLQSVNISLTNGQSTKVLPAVQVAITSNDMTFTWPYILSDFHLASGQYYITVSASNGTNTKYAYQEIYVDAAPTVREAVYAITRGNNTVKIWKFDSVFSVTAGPSLSGNYSSSDVSSYYQQLYITAYDSGNINAIAVPSGTGWSIMGNNSPTPYFTNVYSYGDAAYVSYYAGYVKYFNHSGVIQSEIYMPANYYPVKTLLWGKYLFVEERDISSPAEILALFYAQSGVGYQQISLPGPIIAMYGMDNDNVFIFGNGTSGAPYMSDYSVSGNGFYNPVSLPSAKLLSAAQVNSSEFFVGFSNGTIYNYTYNPINFLSYITGVNASHIRYDAVNNQLVVSSGKQVEEYNCGLSSATKVYSVPMTDSVLDVQILFNK